MEFTPLSQLFVSKERNSSSDFSTIKWLRNVDISTLERIIDSSESFFNFDDNGEELPFECIDYLTLCYMLAEKEGQTDSESLSEEIKYNCLIALATFAQCEKLRREGILEFVGSGKVSEFHTHSTDIKLTQIGNLVKSSMKTMMEICNEIEKNQ